MLKDIFKKVDYYWFFVILTSVLSFGFLITNSSMGIDDESLEMFSDFPVVVSQRRILHYIIGHLIGGYEYIPFFINAVSIIIYILTTVLISDILMKYAFNFDKKQSVLFSSCFISFPLIAFIYIFSEESISYSFCLLFSVIAALLSCKYIFENKNIKHIIFAVLCIFCSISIYESGIMYYLLIMLLIFFNNIINNNDTKNAIKEQFSQKIFLIIFVSITAIAINVIISKLIKLLIPYNFKEINTHILYDFNSIHTFIISFKSAITNFTSNFLNNISPLSPNEGANTACFIIFFCTIAFFILSLFYFIKTKRKELILINIFVYLVILAPLLLTGDAKIPYRVFIPIQVFIAFIIAHLYTFVRANTILSKIFLVIAGYIVFCQAKEINQILYTENVKVKEDRLFAYNLVMDLKRLNLEDKPVIFIGLRKNPQLKHSYSSQADEINISTFNWNRYDSKEAEIWGRKEYRFIRKFGFDIIGYDNSDLFEKYSEKEILTEVENNTKDMPIYPKEGSIKDLGDIVIIKIGESKFDKKEI